MIDELLTCVIFFINVFTIFATLKNNMMKKSIKKTTDILLTNISWISIIIGILLLWGSVSFFDDPKLQGISEKVGLTILSSGVFAAVLKSFQFIGLFRKELETIILDNKFIEKRSDLPELWKSISGNIYQKKFPLISDDLQNIILEKYFPTNHVYYYESVVITINIEEVNSNENILLTQHVKTKGVKEVGAKNVEMVKTIVVEKSQNPKDYKVENLIHKLNNKDILKDCVPIETENEAGDKTYTYKTVLDDSSDRFEIETLDRREYCIKDDNSKLFHVNHITKEMILSISYPDNVKVLFFPLGVIEPFEDLHKEHKNIISKIHRNSLILPNQGFGLTFALIK